LTKPPFWVGGNGSWLPTQISLLSALFLEEDVKDHLDTLRDEAGQTMAEYAVVLGVITIAVVVTLGLLSNKISSLLTGVIASM
jgi:Flp pilus assembly pilin Flp